MEKRDYYEILGVERGADAAALKSAYRRCAKQYHPDVNPGDSTAEERFKEAAEAYEVLSNPERRALYDQYGHAGPRQACFEGFSGMEDIFSHFADIFGMGRGGGQRRGADLQTTVRLSFMEAVKGCQKEITIDRKVPCGVCDGSGAKAGSRPATCPTCGCRGQVLQQMGFVRIASGCPTCRCSGRIVKDKCDECQGGGLVRKTETITLEIPAGVEDGLSMQVSGRGQVMPGRPPGNLFVQFSVENDPRFEREGDDLLTQIQISFPQAALGAKVAVPTIDGDETIEISPGTRPGTVRTLHGRGVPHVERRGRGDLHVRVQIDVPSKLTDEQRTLIQQLSATLTGAPASKQEEETGGGFWSRRKKRK